MNTKPWPADWSPREDYLAAIKTRTHFYQILEKIGDHKNQVSAALKRLVESGRATKEGAFYTASDPDEGAIVGPQVNGAPPPTSWTAPEIRLALQFFGFSPDACGAVLDRLMGIEPPPEAAQETPEPDEELPAE